MLNQLFLFHHYIEFLILYESVHRFLQILQMSSFNKKSRKSAENLCDYGEIIETNNWIRLLIFDDKS